MKKCKVCGKKTEVGFNINFKLVPICESCANQITHQQMQDLLLKNAEKIREIKKAEKQNGS